MATEVTQNYFAWSQEESPVQDSSQGAPQVFDHGSISFGRFELESLAWEKWSVFANDRRHEEFGKFNGLVAKKKAYFEEYFKRIRELKALQQQNQQTELNLEYSGDGSDSSQTGEDVPAADQGSPSGSVTLLDSMVQTEVQTIFEHDLECYDDNDKEMLDKDISPSVGGMRQIGQEFRENASGDNYSDRMVDVLQQNTNSGRDDLGMPSESTMTPKRIVKKDYLVGQAAKIMPKIVKMTSSDIPGRAVVNKGPDSGKSSVVNRRVKTETIQSSQRLKAAVSNIVVDTVGKSKPVLKEVPGVMGVRRPSSPTLQCPSMRERRPVTRDGSRKPPEVATTCRPSTAERRLATRELVLKQANVVPCRPSTPNRRPLTIELAPVHSSIATPCRPSTAERCRPITRGMELMHPSIAAPHRPSTSERRPTTKQMAQKHVGIATPSRPSTAERQPVTRETAWKRADVATLHRPTERHPITRVSAQKHANTVALHRPSTPERRSVAREIAPKHSVVTPACRPSTSERLPAVREAALRHSNFPGSCWPLTPERHLSRESAPMHADIGTTSHRPSTGERRPIAKESAIRLDEKTSIRSRGMLTNPKDAMATVVTPQKSITQRLVKSSKPEMKRCAKERVELQTVGKHKASSVNLTPREMLTSNVRANRVLENFRKPNKEGILGAVRSQISTSKSATPSQSRSIKTRAPNPPPPPPPLWRPSQISSKTNTNNLSVGGRKPKASTPHWH